MDAALPLSVNGPVALGAELAGLGVIKSLVIEGSQFVAILGIVTVDAAGIQSVLQFDVGVLMQVGGMGFCIDDDVAIHAGSFETVDHGFGGI